MGPELVHADERTNGRTDIHDKNNVTFRDFSTLLKKPKLSTPQILLRDT